MLIMVVIMLETEVIKLFHAELKWAWQSVFLIDVKYTFEGMKELKFFTTQKFIQLINMKMPTNSGILIFMSRINLMLSWAWQWKKVLLPRMQLKLGTMCD